MPWKTAVLTRVSNTGMWSCLLSNRYLDMSASCAVASVFFGDIVVGPGLEFLCKEGSVVITHLQLKLTCSENHASAIDRLLRYKAASVILWLA